jgi:4-amino-4-deoxy-L-arabinose transferase-like glycosyltransferase
MYFIRTQLRAGASFVASVRGKIAALRSGDWAALEHLLLVCFLVGKAFFFLQHLGIPFGFDVGAHLEMLTRYTWLHPTADVHGSFYGYHPPMAFLLARTLMLIGATDVMSVQLVNVTASLVAFFALRSLLKHLSLLARPAPIAFLYLTFALPILVHASMSINLDMIVFALAAAILLCGVRLFWTEDALSRGDKGTLLVSMVACLLLGIMTKFSGVLLLAIPFLVAVLRPQGFSLRPLFSAALVGCIAIAIAFPYYYSRYKIPEGTFFPNNGDWIIGDALVGARKIRDEAPTEFFLTLFRPTSVHAEGGLRQRDHAAVRLADTWRDIFLKDDYLGPTSAATEWVGTMEFMLSPWLLLLGLLLFLRRARRRSAWQRLGFVLIAFAIVQWAALIYHSYQNPYADWIPAKGIYILPSLFALGYLAALLMHARFSAPAFLSRYWKTVQRGFLLAIGALLLLHSFVPVY